MKFNVRLAGLILFFLSNPGNAQDKAEMADTASINALLQQSKQYLAKVPDSAILLATQAVEASKRINFIQGQALGLKNIGIVYYYQGKYLETLEYWRQSLKMYEDLKDEKGIANLLNNIGAAYNDQGDDSRALEYSLKSLQISEKLGDKFRILSALNTVANIYYNKKSTWDTALNYLLRALPLCEETGNKEAQGVIEENIGEIYFYKKDDVKALDYYNRAVASLEGNINISFAYNGIGKLYAKKGNYPTALAYHRKALELAEKLDGKLHMVRSLQGLANVYIKLNDFPTAINHYKQAERLALELQSTPNLKDLYEEMAQAYEKSGDFKNAYVYQARLDKVKDTLFNEITQRKLGTLQLEFDLEKKQSEINLLTKDNDLQALSIKKQRFAKNAFLVGLLFIAFITVLILRSYRMKIKTHRILNRQKKEIETLLLNILPAEVAQELQEKGHSEPRHYGNVSVMFTDFKGFTFIADRMSPQDLIKELGSCFIAFDGIIEKYNLEKIKTIGDSYMCAGGIPTPDEDHVINMIKASLEMQQFIREYNRQRTERGLACWDARIGIHVGPLVAGVIGKKKYAYDIWGSTVNIASRMESNGAPGKVNISSATYELIKHRFACSYRGKIDAKNIGEIDMYFVDHDIQDLVEEEKGKVYVAKQEVNVSGA